MFPFVIDHPLYSDETLKNCQKELTGANTQLFYITTSKLTLLGALVECARANILMACSEFRSELKKQQSNFKNKIANFGDDSLLEFFLFQ